MSSGKQISFAKGEVSQLERYKASDVTYQNGLNKLRNMYVRRGGGVSNFPGWIPTLGFLPEGFKGNGLFRVDNGLPLSDPFSKALESWIPNNYESPSIYKIRGLYFVKQKPIKGIWADENGYRISIYEADNIEGQDYVIYRTFATEEDLVNFDLRQIEVIEERDRYIISPGFKAKILDPNSSLTQYRVGVHAIEKGSFYDLVEKLVESQSVLPVGAPYNAPLGGLVPPTLYAAAKWVYNNDVGLQRDVVRYLVTGEDKYNNESSYARMETPYTLTGNVPVANTGDVILLPYANSTGHLTNTLRFNINSATAASQIKNVRTYRANAVRLDTSEPLFGLVGQESIDPRSAEVNAVTIDAGARDIATTPPLDFSMIPPQAMGVGIENTYPYQGVLANHICKYQGRMVVAGEPFNRNGVEVKSGEVLVSKLGAPMQFTAPQISKDVGAFRFSVPATDNSEVVACDEFHRLILFTEKGCYAAMGGQGGALTPLTTNPKTLSSVGCSKTVKPTKLAQNLFYLSNDHSKIMAIYYNEQYGFNVLDISASFQHFFDEEIVQIKAISETESFLYALRSDGKIILINVNTEGGIGASLLDLGCKVIYLQEERLKDPASLSVYDVSDKVERNSLVFGAIKNNVYVEGRVPHRVDNNYILEYYLNCGQKYGSYLKDMGSLGFNQKSLEDPSYGLVEYANIDTTVPGNWTEGTLLEVNFTRPAHLDAWGNIPPKYHFYYTEGGLVKRATLTTVADAGPTIAGYQHSVTGYMDMDVPDVWRNRRGANLDTDDEELNRDSSMWLPTMVIHRSSSYSALGGDYHVRGLIAPALLALDKPLYKRDSAGNVVFNYTSPVNIDLAFLAENKIVSSPLNEKIGTPQKLELEFWLTAGVPKIAANVYLNDPAENFTLGMPFKSEMETLDIEASDARTLTSGNKNINILGVALHRTKSGKVGTSEAPDETYFEEIEVNRELDFEGTDKEYFNGVRNVHFQGNYNDHGRVKVINVDPVPITVVSVYPKGVSSGG